MTYSIIKKSQLEGASRLDAEYYQPEYLDLNLKLKSRKSQPLDDLAEKIICGPFGSEILKGDYQESGAPLIRVANLNNYFVRDDDLIFIDKTLGEKLKKYQVSDGDLVVSQRGTIAMFSKVTNEYPTWNISANLISIKKSNKLDFDYLLAFLNSDYGIKQLYRRLSGQVQSKITTDDVKQIRIFVPDSAKQQEISNVVNKAWNEQENSEKFYQQAEVLLLEKLGLKDFKTENSLSSIVNFSDIKESNRIDAEYFQEKYQKLTNRLKKNKLTSLFNCFDILKSKYFDYKDDGDIGVIKTKQLGRQFIDFQTESKTTQEIINKGRLPIIENNDVIFASMGASVLWEKQIFIMILRTKIKNLP